VPAIPSPPYGRRHLRNFRRYLEALYLLDALFYWDVSFECLGFETFKDKLTAQLVRSPPSPSPISWCPVRKSHWSVGVHRSRFSLSLSTLPYPSLLNPYLTLPHNQSPGTPSPLTILSRSMFLRIVGSSTESLVHSS